MAFPFVFHVMVLAINFLLGILSLDTQYHITRNKVFDQEIKLTYISTIDVIANILTIIIVIINFWIVHVSLQCVYSWAMAWIPKKIYFLFIL